MTRCVLYTARDGQVIGFLCAGHAAFADEGQDIVCAAVSVLTETCVNALERVAHVKPIVRTGTGFLAAKLPEGTASQDAKTLLNGMTEGLRDIAAQYPDHFRLDTMAVSEWR